MKEDGQIKIRGNEDNNRRDRFLLCEGRRFTSWGGCNHHGERNGKVLNGIEASKQQDYSSTYSAMHLLMTATPEIKKPAINNCKGHLRTSIVANSCWWWHQRGLRQLEFWTGNGKRRIAMERLEEWWCSQQHDHRRNFIPASHHLQIRVDIPKWAGSLDQVDHLVVSRAWGRSLLGVRVRRGADASSDHHLVTAKVGLKLRAAIPNWQT